MAASLTQIFLNGPGLYTSWQLWTGNGLGLLRALSTSTTSGPKLSMWRACMEIRSRAHLSAATSGRKWARAAESPLHFDNLRPKVVDLESLGSPHKMYLAHKKPSPLGPFV